MMCLKASNHERLAEHLRTLAIGAGGFGSGRIVANPDRTPFGFTSGLPVIRPEAGGPLTDPATRLK